MAGLIVRCDMREPFQEKAFHASALSHASELAAHTDFLFFFFLLKRCTACGIVRVSEQVRTCEFSKKVLKHI